MRTDRDSVSSRPRTNKTAHMVKLQDKKGRCDHTHTRTPSQSTHRPGHEDSPRLPALVAEVDQAGDVEQKLHKVVQHQQDQTQTVQAERHASPRYNAGRVEERGVGGREGGGHMFHTITSFQWEAALTSECRRPRCGPGTGRCTRAAVEYPPKR